MTQPVKEVRVLGFEEEEERRRLRRQQATHIDAKSLLPKGPYTFHDFRTLELRFIEVRVAVLSWKGRYDVKP